MNQQNWRNDETSPKVEIRCEKLLKHLIFLRVAGKNVQRILVSVAP